MRLGPYLLLWIKVVVPVLGLGPVIKAMVPVPWLLLQLMFVQCNCPFKQYAIYVCCNHGKFVHLDIYTWTYMRCWHSKYCVHSLTASCTQDVGIASCRAIWHYVVLVSSALSLHTHDHLLMVYTVTWQCLLTCEPHTQEGLPYLFIMTGTEEVGN